MPKIDGGFKVDHNISGWLSLADLQSKFMLDGIFINAALGLYNKLMHIIEAITKLL
ncbi:hypothetical protein [Acinetobacter kookii]|uniref:hypothetical protein n=1 Tax=Acinetobacter kookii TaxID=1226327 RepID=UPI00148A72AF|nr:hypothetical protein [Acinetobacter kookii]